MSRTNASRGKGGKESLLRRTDYPFQLLLLRLRSEAASPSTPFRLAPVIPFTFDEGPGGSRGGGGPGREGLRRRDFLLTLCRAYDHMVTPTLY